MSSSILGTIGREVMRAMLERTQSMDTGQMMSAFGASEPVVYDDVEETLNIAYVNREEYALAMDVFKPKTERGVELPVIVIVHGGGLFMGQRDLERPYSRLLAHKGYLVFSLEYRLAPKATVFQQFDDVCAGMDHVGQMLVNYDVDFSRVFLMADSAGAYLTAYVAAMHDSVKLQNAIGYKPSRMVFAAVGFICGMFYTNKALEDQILGDKRDDQDFRKYMSIEHPEIVNNLPPAFLLTSCGDTFNNFSIRFNKVLKEAGRTSKLLYLGDEELMHIFPITNPEDPRSIKATDRMLAWFEEQADLRRASRRANPVLTRKRNKLKRRIKEGTIYKQKAWANIKERVLVDPANLGKTALIDCTREYTYEQMFAEWERYARVFSALGINSASRSRVALCGAITAEPLFALFGLNMTGAEVSLFSYPDFLPNGMWKDMVEKERITDLVISDIMVTPEVWEEIVEVKQACSLQHVILMHSLMGGPAIGPAEMIYNECNYHALRRLPGTVFMQDLLVEHQDAEIALDGSKGERLAFIVHTSGTTHGTRKMLPYTDLVFNKSMSFSPDGSRAYLDHSDVAKPQRILASYDFSSIYGLAGQCYGCFAMADALVLTYFGFMHPKFLRAVDYYNATNINVTGLMVDKWLDRSDLDKVDLCSLKFVGLSGGYVSPDKLARYNAFFREHGFGGDVMTFYGMSEAGGKILAADREQVEEKDSLGFFDESDDVLIKDENDGQFYRPSDGPRTGVLYHYSENRPSNKLDGETLFTYTEIDGKDYLCTNDLIRVNEDGSVSFAGRTDEFFVNNEGKTFSSGIVNQRMAQCAAVDRCAVVPVFEKRIHDTVPVLYVVPADKGCKDAEGIRQALLDVYVRERAIPADNLPTQVMLVDDIPLNANGKLDVFRITRERIDGQAYNIVPMKEGDTLVDVRLELVRRLNGMTGGTLPEGMENNSSYNVFDLFTSTPASKGDGPSLLDPLGLGRLLAPSAEGRPAFELPPIPDDVMKTVMKYGNRLAGISNGRKWIDVDFED